jgi:hypothetical protein
MILLGRGPWAVAVGGRGLWTEPGGAMVAAAVDRQLARATAYPPRPAHRLRPTAHRLKPVRRLFRAVLVECVREIPHDRIHTLTFDLPPLHHPDQLPVAQDGH